MSEPAARPAHDLPREPPREPPREQGRQQGQEPAQEAVGAPRWGRVASGLLLAVACTAGVLGLHRLLVLSVQGQVVDEATRAGARAGEDAFGGSAQAVIDALLDVVSVLSLLLVLVVVAAVALARRRVGAAVAAVVLVVGSTATTQVLKLLLPRPVLVDVGFDENTLPSGHTTFAAGAAAALLLVAPPRTRPAVAVAGAAYTAGTGVATLVADWHRASDVLAAVLVVGAWAGLVAALLAAAPRGGGSGDGGHGPVTALLLVAAGVGAVGAVLLLGRAWVVLDPASRRLEEGLAAVGGGLAIAAASCAVQAAVLALRRRPRTTRPDGRVR